MTRRQLTDDQWKFIESCLPMGGFGPYPERLRERPRHPSPGPAGLRPQPAGRATGRAPGMACRVERASAPVAVHRDAAAVRGAGCLRGGGRRHHCCASTSGVSAQCRSTFTWANLKARPSGNLAPDGPPLAQGRSRIARRRLRRRSRDPVPAVNVLLSEIAFAQWPVTEYRDRPLRRRLKPTASP